MQCFSWECYVFIFILRNCPNGGQFDTFQCRILGSLNVQSGKVSYENNPQQTKSRKPAFLGFSKNVGVTILEQFQSIRYAAEMKLFYVFFFFSCILAGVLSFRGGHGRPLYGVIADVNYADDSIPLRGFEGIKSRGSRGYGSW